MRSGVARWARTSAGRWAGVLLLALHAAPAARADELDDALFALQRDWEVVRYQTPALERPRRYEALAGRAHALCEAHPARSEPLVWEGAILGAWADDRSGLAALRLQVRAKARYEAALRIDARGLDGFALHELGRLYASAPGWPFGFGDAQRARELLREALQLDPDGIDSNAAYGEFLAGHGQPQEAGTYLRKAIAQAPRPGHLVGDTGRREEARALLARLQGAR